MGRRSPNTAAADAPAYIMLPYWQCMKCLCVMHDPKWTGPSNRNCLYCKSAGKRVYSWPGISGDVYHAALYRFRNNTDWVAISLQAIVLCSLAEVHGSRLIWSILVRQKCPKEVALSINRSIRPQEYLKLFEELIGKKARQLRQGGKYKQFWCDLEKLRKFRNGFVHREPKKSGREVTDIPKDIGAVINSVTRNMEPAFQELTNKSLAEAECKS